jgi:hypothetical protein
MCSGVGDLTRLAMISIKLRFCIDQIAAQALLRLKMVLETQP